MAGSWGLGWASSPDSPVTGHGRVWPERIIRVLWQGGDCHISLPSFHKQVLSAQDATHEKPMDPPYMGPANNARMWQVAEGLGVPCPAFLRVVSQAGRFCLTDLKRYISPSHIEYCSRSLVSLELVKGCVHESNYNKNGNKAPVCGQRSQKERKKRKGKMVKRKDRLTQSRRTNSATSLNAAKVTSNCSGLHVAVMLMWSAEENVPLRGMRVKSSRRAAGNKTNNFFSWQFYLFICQIHFLSWIVKKTATLLESSNFLSSTYT